MLIGAIGVLALDLRDLSRENGWWAPEAAAARAAFRSDPAAGGRDRRADRRPAIRAASSPRDEAKLGRPMTFTLGSGGVLAAEGSIEPGTAARFAAEIEARGEYVKTVSLNSPGGALDDAMAMAKLLREQGHRDRSRRRRALRLVLPAVLCRRQDADGRREGGRRRAPVLCRYADRQPRRHRRCPTRRRRPRRISRHLAEMGVDPALWLHALDTPPQALYYFSPEELAKYRLVTTPVVTAGGAAIRKRWNRHSARVRRQANQADRRASSPASAHARAAARS